MDTPTQKNGFNESQRTSNSKRIRPSGGYRRLRSFQAATVIYDATVSFCARFLDKRSRTVDQMVRAARSGRQNHALGVTEGSRASATSTQTELRLVNVARASLDELLLDFENFLRQRGLRQWEKDDPEAQAVREVGKSHQTDRSDPTDRSDEAHYSPWVTHADPGVVANAVICLIHQTNYLLDRQIAGLEREFIRDGGYSERLAAARIEERKRQDRTERSDPTDRSKKKLPPCPLCGKPLVVRTARKGERAGSQFLGCSGYPNCRGTLPLNGSVRSDRSL
jgi:restriction system protein